jgi:outer membrane protein TolC
MATREQQNAAKEKMEAAEAALLDYVNRSPDVDADPALHRRLNEDLRLAMDEFLEVMK